MKIQEVKTINCIKENDLVLFIGDNSSIFTVDRITKINDNGSYEYINIEGKNFQGNLTKNLDQFKTFIVDESIFSYLNKQLNDKFTTIDGLFFNLFKSKAVSSVLYEKLNKTQSDLNLRVKFIDFVNNNLDEIYDIVWMNDEELRKSDKRLSYCQNKLITELDAVLKIA